MANIIRNSKSGSDWTKSDLDAYRIRIRICKEKEFFGEDPKDLILNLDQDIITFDYTKGDRSTLKKSSRKLLGFLDLASKARHESAVDDFAKELLSGMDYDSNDRLIRSRNIIPLVMCGIQTTAQTDICVMKEICEILLLVQEDKRLSSTKDPEPQVIAEAIAAFQNNNRIRKNNGAKPLESMMIPCITMVGTSPVFYLVPVTKELDYSITNGTYPDSDTEVFLCVPKVKRCSDGMKPLENRKKILQCFEAFKKFVDDLEKDLEIPEDESE